MEKIRRYVPIILVVIFLLGFIWLLLDNNGIAIHKKIDNTITAGIYTDGSQVGETTVVISGKYYPHLFRPDNFWGIFSVQELPETENNGINAEITWHEEKFDGMHYEYQLITYHGYKAGDFYIEETEGADMISINRNMDEFVWVIGKGRVLATSQEAYQNYLERKLDKH